MNAPAEVSRKERILGGLWGALVGDALGVPVEFRSREELRRNPVRDMRGHGTHHQPRGTWSDDGALTLCTVDSLLHSEFDTEDMGKRFVAWYENGLWTAHGAVFDVGSTTADALILISNGTAAEQAGGRDERSNGNGSLMRILPVALRFAREPVEKLLDRIGRASAITHGHARSRMACGFCALVVQQLLEGVLPKPALDRARSVFVQTFAAASELQHFRHLVHEDLSAKPEDWVVSSGYVIATLTTSLWSLLTTSSFEQCVLTAVNLGGDTDTTGCVAGGLAGVAYGLRSIPERWCRALPRCNELEPLLMKFANLAVGPF